jgi:hypothetical protein
MVLFLKLVYLSVLSKNIRKTIVSVFCPLLVLRGVAGRRHLRVRHPRPPPDEHHLLRQAGTASAGNATLFH